LKRTFGDNLFFRAAAYAGFRPPTLNELHRPFRVGNDITEANAALDPEHLYGIDAAFGGSALSGVGAWSWSLGAFATRLSNPITNVTEGVGPGTFPPNVVVPAGGVYRVRENAGRIDAYGLEAEAHGSLSEALDWRIAFDVTHARVDGGREAPQLTGLRPAQAPSWTATAGVSWRAWAGGEVSADARAESERFDDDQNTRRLGAFTDVDLRVSQRVSESAELYLALDNAFDGAVATASAADGTLSYAAPRALRVGFRLAR
jgi:outer membrane receptor protein involved in Fe transport